MSDWRDPERLRELYWDEEMSTYQIAEELGCTRKTVRKWMNRFGIDRRSSTEGLRVSSSADYATFRTSKQGYEEWVTRHRGDQWGVQVHRLAAVAYTGFEAVADKVVHHDNRVPWDNREENLSIMSRSEHSVHHTTDRSRNNEGDFVG